MNSSPPNTSMNPQRLLAICLVIGATLFLVSISSPQTPPHMLRPGDGSFIQDFSSSPSSPTSSDNDPNTNKKQSSSSPSSSSSSIVSNSAFWTRSTGGRISPAKSTSIITNSGPVASINSGESCSVKPNVEREGFLIQCPIAVRQGKDGKLMLNPKLVTKGNKLDVVIEFENSVSKIVDTKCRQTIESSFAHSQKIPLYEKEVSGNCQPSLSSSIIKSDANNEISVSIDLSDSTDQLLKVIRTTSMEVNRKRETSGIKKTNILIPIGDESNKNFEITDLTFRDRVLMLVTEIDFKIESPAPVSAWKTCFIAIGDWGGYQKQSIAVSKLLESTLEKRPEIRFIVSTGDNFYPTGVKSLNDPQFKNVFEKLYSGTYTRPLMWIQSAGNHDQWGLPPQLEYGKQKSDRWYFPSRAFSVAFPHLKIQAPTKKNGRKNEKEDNDDETTIRGKRVGMITVVDSYGPKIDYQLKALKKSLAIPEERQLISPNVGEDKTEDSNAEQERRKKIEKKQKKKNNNDQEDNKYWKIVVGHMPLYSGSNHGKEARTFNQRPKYRNAFLDARVNVYLNGDDHLLEVHRVDLSSPSAAAPSKTLSSTSSSSGKTESSNDAGKPRFVDYFTTGAGGGSEMYGADLYDTTYLSYPQAKGFTVHCFDASSGGENAEQMMTSEFYMVDGFSKNRVGGTAKKEVDSMKAVPMMKTRLS